ncbi:MAG TPA: amidohydrolase family protein, partial [Gemmataceae bacterium]
LKAEKLAPINRDFLPQDLKPLIDAAGIRRTVFVQTQHTVEENRWALKLAGENDWIAGVVGWVDLAGEKCEEQLLEFKDHPKFVGVRHITQDEPDDDFIVREDVLRGLKVLEKHGVPFDLLFYVKHLRHAATLAEKLPDLPMVIDHLSKPEIKLRRTDNWIDHLRAAARHPNVYCKLSGMITEADWQNWKPADLKPYVQAALECFGPDRCMFGSDWPVCLLAGSYQQVVDALDEALGPISAEERAKIFGGTAIRFYKLQG